jgi:hypothetical protein
MSDFICFKQHYYKTFVAFVHSKKGDKGKSSDVFDNDICNERSSGQRRSGRRPQVSRHSADLQRPRIEPLHGVAAGLDVHVVGSGVDAISHL